MNRVRQGAAWAGGAALLAGMGGWLWRETQRARKRQQTQLEAGGLYDLEEVTLGGQPQWVLMRGQHPENPVLLMLHGGPGLPLMPAYPWLAALEQAFVVVYWDQRGAGKSYHPNIPAGSMTPAQLLSDARELVDWLRGRLNRQRVYVMGHSWGSVLGLRLAAQAPEVVAGYIGVGQVTRLATSEWLGYEWLQNQARSERNPLWRKAVASIGEPPYRTPRMTLLQRKAVDHYGGGFYPGAPSGVNTMRYSQAAMTLPEYSLAESMVQYPRGLDFCHQHLWYPMYDTTDLPTEIPRVEVPVTFVHGRHDQIVPLSTLTPYVDQLEAPRGKALHVFERSAHFPLLEEPDRFQAVAIEFAQQTQALS